MYCRVAVMSLVTRIKCKRKRKSRFCVVANKNSHKHVHLSLFHYCCKYGKNPIVSFKQNTKEQSTKRNLQTAIGKKNITNKVISKDIRRDMNR